MWGHVIVESENPTACPILEFSVGSSCSWSVSLGSTREGWEGGFATYLVSSMLVKFGEGVGAVKWGFRLSAELHQARVRSLAPPSGVELWKQRSISQLLKFKVWLLFGIQNTTAFLKNTRVCFFRWEVQGDFTDNQSANTTHCRADAKGTNVAATPKQWVSRQCSWMYGTC